MPKHLLITRRSLAAEKGMRMIGTRPTVDPQDVERFWDENPLFVGEAPFEPGTREFFEFQDRVMIQDNYAGRLDERTLPKCPKQGRILELGCGPGFWLQVFHERGFTDLTGVDISQRTVDLARKRCELYGIPAKLEQANAENLSFDDAAFDHVHCTGVMQYAIDPDAPLREIRRVLKPGGTAVLSCYYDFFLLRHWSKMRFLRTALYRLGVGRSAGRGRASLLLVDGDKIEILRKFDGQNNPISACYSRREYAELLGRHFLVEEVYFHFFPARLLPLNVPRWLRRLLERMLPMHIYANVRAPEQSA